MKRTLKHTTEMRNFSDEAARRNVRKKTIFSDKKLNSIKKFR